MLKRLTKSLTENDFTTLALATAWVTACYSFYLDSTTGSNWFARSGSLIVIFSVASEYLLLKEKNDYLYFLITKGRLNTENSLQPKGFLAPNNSHSLKEKLSHVSVIFGTLIWGYGDLLL